MTTFTISQARYIAAASVCQSVEDVRYYLTGVHFSPAARCAGGRITGTDGCRLLDIHDADAPDPYPDVIIAFTKGQLASFKKRGAADMPVKITVDGALARVDHNGVTSAATVIDGQYPDVDRAIPAGDREGSASAIGLNPRYLGDFGTVARILTGAKEPGVRLRFGDANSAIRVEFLAGEEGVLPGVVGVMMPLRI